MTKGVVKEKKNLDKHIEKQMGCMAGFLHIFDRHQMLNGKRIYSTKRLPPSDTPESVSSPEPEKLGASPVVLTPTPSSPVSERVSHPPTPEPSQTPKTSLPLRVFEFKEGTRSSWKFSKEAPRLSLDSRAVVDAKGTLRPREIRTSNTSSTNQCENHAEVEKQRRSTSVIARLMGLEEPTPDTDSGSGHKVELRRSASESRASRDLPQYRYFDANNFQLKQSQHSNYSRDNADGDQRLSNGRLTDPNPFSAGKVKTEPVTARAPLRNRGMGQKKSFYDSADFFPEPKHNVSIYGEIERRLKIRGIEEPSKDLDTLKQILEAVHLKGLLHSKNSHHHRNFLHANDSPIVLMKPATVKSSASLNRTGRNGFDSPPPSSFGSSPRARRNNVTLAAAGPKTDHRNVKAVSQARARNSNTPTRSESGMRKMANMETPRKVSDGTVDPSRNSPVNFVKLNSRRNNAHDQHVTSRSPRIRRGTYQKEEMVMSVAEDELSTISESSSFSTSSHTDTERLKTDEYKEGRNLLERCDKLLNSIAEITAGTELQPSPVSVLDTSFYKDESSCSPSPVMKRCIDYKDQAAAESEDDMWSAALCSSEGKSDESTEDSDFVYVSDILRASNYLPEDSNVFLLLEKQQYLKGNDISKSSTLRRRLIFDTIHEILNQNRLLPPWKAASWAEKTPAPVDRIWMQFRRIRERRQEEEESEDLFEVICGVLRKDVAENEWEECPVEMGDVVLDMERLVFKDLIGEAIRDLALLKGPQCNRVSELRRKLEF